MPPHNPNALAESLIPRAIIGLLREGQPVTFRAHGRSMWPAIPSGSLVRVLPCTVFELKRRSIVAFERNGTIVLHRVAKLEVSSKTCKRLECRGEFTRGPLELVAPSAVLGLVQVVSRRPLNLRIPQLDELCSLARTLAHRVIDFLV